MPLRMDQMQAGMPLTGRCNSRSNEWGLSARERELLSYSACCSLWVARTLPQSDLLLVVGIGAGRQLSAFPQILQKPVIDPFGKHLPPQHLYGATRRAEYLSVE